MARQSFELVGGKILIKCYAMKKTFLSLDLLFINENYILELPTFQEVLIGGEKCAVRNFSSAGDQGPFLFHQMIACNTSKCFQLKKGEWEERASMVTPGRLGAASSSYADKDDWIVTGGTLKNGTTLKTSEIYDTETNNWIQGPELPLHLTQHCQVQAFGEVIITG